MEVIRELRPDITFVGSSSDYDVPVATWEAQTRVVLSTLSQYSSRTVLIVDTPPAGIDIPSCLARAEWRPGTFLDPDCKPRGNRDEQERAAAQVRAASKMPRVDILDMRMEVCEVGICDATMNGIVRYRDEGHIARDFAYTFSGHFLAYLTDIAD